MNASIPKLVLLPGMDGTGILFKDFVAKLPESLIADVIQYPTDQILSYAELISLVQSILPASEPFVLMAESFSTPIAVHCAANDLPNLKGLILCAGFVTSPVRGLRRVIVSSLAPILFYLKLPRFVARLALVGSDAPDSLVESVRSAVASVAPMVLATRLRAVLACDARAELGKVAAPALYLHAIQDKVVALQCLDEILKISPKLRWLKSKAHICSYSESPTQPPRS